MLNKITTSPQVWPQYKYTPPQDLFSVQCEEDVGYLPVLHCSLSGWDEDCGVIFPLLCSVVLLCMRKSQEENRRTFLHIPTVSGRLVVKCSPSGRAAAANRYCLFACASFGMKLIGLLSATASLHWFGWWSK